MRPLSFTLISLLLLSISGCLMGPSFEPPRTDMPQYWVSPLAGDVSTQQGDIVDWWKLFGDSVLNTLVETALNANLDLKVAEARIRESRALRGVIAANLRPSGGVSTAYTFEGSPKAPKIETKPSATVGLSDGPGGTNHSITVHSDNFTLGRTTSNAGDTSSITLTPNSFEMPDRTQNLFSSGFDAHWELDIFGGINREIEATDAEVEAAKENLHYLQVTLTSEVARNYFELRGAQQNLEITKQNIAVQQNTHSIASLRFEGGLTSGLDAQQAQSQLSLTESQVPFLEFTILASIYRLAVLTGQMPQMLVDDLSNAAPLPATPPVVPIGLPSEILVRRPDIRRSERQLHAATARIGVATADLFPKFSMTGRISADTPNLNTLSLGDAAFWSLGPAIQFPIFDRSRIRANIEVHNARQEAAMYSYEQAVLIAMEDAEQALTAYAKEQVRRASLEESMLASRRAVALANDLYTEGLADFINVLQAQGTLFTTQYQLVKSEQSILLDLVAIYKAIGGGWSNKGRNGEIEDQEAIPVVTSATEGSNAN